MESISCRSSGVYDHNGAVVIRLFPRFIPSEPEKAAKRVLHNSSMRDHRQRSVPWLGDHHLEFTFYSSDKVSIGFAFGRRSLGELAEPQLGFCRIPPLDLVPSQTFPLPKMHLAKTESEFNRHADSLT